MKASTLKALRLPAGILLVFGILTIAVFVYSDRLSKANLPRLRRSPIASTVLPVSTR